MSIKRVLAADLGASGGRVMLGTYDGTRIGLKELHRFSNDPVFLNGTMYWDFLRQFHEIKQGLIKAKPYGLIDSLGVDTWGVDFGLVDGKGCLLENPVHYRDKRTKGMLGKAFEKIDPDRFYQITGSQFMEINSVFQLLALKEQRPELLDRAEKLLMMPDLFNYFLSGVMAWEYSIASTTQLLDAKGQTWSEEILCCLDLPRRLLGPVVPCGTVLGSLKLEICEELGINPAAVIAAAGHDTQSALAAVPAEEEFVFISCGTWALFGTELSEPLLTPLSRHYNITNEGGVEGRTSFLKNIIGLWLIQESRRQWIREGREYDFGRLEKMAAEAKSFQAFIDPDDPVFIPAGNIPERIQEYCRKTGQKELKKEGEIVRCIDESLAFKYRDAFEEISRCTGKEYKVIHMVGGGTQSGLLCQMTANACGCRVLAGPTEATVLGNMAVQLMALGELTSLSKAREVIKNSVEVKVYEPQDIEAWDKAYERFKKISEKK